MAITNTITRRAALTGATAAAIAPLAAAPALAAADPAIAAHAAWEAARAASEAAHDSYEAQPRPAMPCEHLATVRDPRAPGGTREIYAYDLHALTPAAEMKGAFIGRDFAGEMPEAERLEKYERLRAALDARSTKTLASPAAKRAAKLDRIEDEAWNAFLDTPATTLAGVVAKLRANSETAEDAYVVAALRDLDRMKNTPLAA